MSVPLVPPRLERTLSAVFRFYDVFFFSMVPPDERTPPIASPLEVTIPEIGWNALRVADDSTYRFSALTMTQPAPRRPEPGHPSPFSVKVVAPGGDYVALEDILLTLPRALSAPPIPADFLIPTPLWPTTAMRPPGGETAVRGIIRSATAPVSGLKVEMWVGPTGTPPAGTPYTRSNAGGEFLFRFPLLNGVAGSSLALRIRLNGGAITVTPSSPPVVMGRTQIIEFHT